MYWQDVLGRLFEKNIGISISGTLLLILDIEYMLEDSSLNGLGLNFLDVQKSEVKKKEFSLLDQILSC